MLRAIGVVERVGGCSVVGSCVVAVPGFAGLAVSLEFQTWSSLAAICSMVRPVTTQLGASSVMAGSVVGALEVVVLFDEEPVGLAGSSRLPDLPLHADEGPFSLQLGRRAG